MSKTMLRAVDDPGRSRADRRREARMLLKGRPRQTHTGIKRNAWHSKYWSNLLVGKR